METEGHISDNRVLSMCLRAPRKQVLAAAAALALVIAVVDYSIGLAVSLGAFYVIPVILASTALSRAQIVLVAALGAVLRVAFNPAPSALELVLGFLMASLAYVGAGFFVSELVRNRTLTLRHMNEMRRQERLRAEAEQQLRLLAESSPAAIMTIDADGRVLAANKAAHELLALAPEKSLAGCEIAQYLPVLSDALKAAPGAVSFRTAAQCRGRRASGEAFFAHTWFSTYPSPQGTRLAAIAVDSSEEMREREEQNLQQLLRTNRVVAGAVSHDIRNMCAAIGVVYSNLKRQNALLEDEDFRALGSLVEGLSRIAAAELESRRSADHARVNATEALEQLRVMIAPTWADNDCTLIWEVPDDPMLVRGELTGLLQVFLNLASNSFRAVQGCNERVLRIEVRRTDERAMVRFHDSGTGVTSPADLFQPFQPRANGSGMGLYVSRAVLRSYGGELRYELSQVGSTFCVDLQRVTSSAQAA